jgi:hypothetical protein
VKKNFVTSKLVFLFMSQVYLHSGLVSNIKLFCSPLLTLQLRMLVLKGRKVSLLGERSTSKKSICQKHQPEPLGHLMFLLTFGGLTMSPCISPLGSLRLARGANPSSFGVSIDRNKSFINGTPAASSGPKILKKVFFF